MNKMILYSKKNAFLLLTCLIGISQLYANNVISYVDTSLNDSQKYVLKVDGKPFHMTNIQVRMDLMRHSEKWPAEMREAMIATISTDGFNTVSIPIHWYEVEPEKNQFDWSIIDEYLGYMNKYNLKMEMLWFGTNSGGHVQWLSRSKTDPVHLRVPDYVLYAPDYGAPNWSNRNEEGFSATQSEYNIRRKDMSNYSLDLEDNRLRDRETYVLGKVMAHIAEWDTNNGSKHPVVGVQIGNEVIGMHNPYNNTLVNSYLNHVASAVKNSDYIVWTRVNCVFWDVYSRVLENERLRMTPEGTNIDFIGIDTYSHHFPTAEGFVASMRDNIPLLIEEDDLKLPYQEMRYALMIGELDAFVKHISSVLSSVSYSISKVSEGFIHSNIHLILKLLGFKINSEVETCIGRIDAVIEFENKIYIFEFKMSSAKEAINQIKEKEYAKPYLMENKEIIIVGVKFDAATRNIGDYISEKK